VCHDKHVKLTVPKFLKVFGILIGLVLLYTAVRLPDELAASIVWDRAQAAWDRKDYAEAEREYQATLHYFPNSVSVLGKVARAADANGDTVEFGRVMDTLAQLGKNDSEASLEMARVLMETPRKK
jgi:hypothetical protein